MAENKATKTIKFIYHRPCLTNDETTNVKLNAYIDKLMPQINKEVKASNGTNVCCNYIKHHKENTIQINGINTIPFGVYEFRFLKSRIDIPSIMDYNTHKLSPLEINDNERIAEETVCLYDATTNIFIAEINRNAVSVSNITNIFNKFVDNKEDYIEFVPMGELNAFEKAIAQKTSYYLNLRLTNVGDMDINNKITENESIKNIVSMANSLTVPQEYAVQVEISLRITENTKKHGFINEKLKALLQKLRPMISDGKVDKLNLKGYNFSDDKMEELNLIENIIHDKQNFIISAQNRFISSDKIFHAMVSNYSEKRIKFLINKT